MSDRLPALRFAVLGVHHLHVLGMANTLRAAGAELAAFHSAGSPLEDLFARAFPEARRATQPHEILEDESIALVACACIPDERADVATRAMRHAKDVLVDKPGAISLEQLETLRSVQRETQRIWAVYFSERLENAATLRASQLVWDGAIGRPIHVEGLGPHRLGPSRPAWFYERARYGGILADLGAHQVDQFLHFTGSSGAEVAAAQVANWNHPEYPELEDFGELLLRADAATGYARVDWFTPDGLETWGDVRLSVIGTEGTLEVRKNCDLAGRAGGDHLFLIDREGVRHVDCADQPRTFGSDFLRDVAQRTQTALSQDHCFAATEIALRAQAQASRLGHLGRAR